MTGKQDQIQLLLITKIHNNLAEIYIKKAEFAFKVVFPDHYETKRETV